MGIASVLQNTFKEQLLGGYHSFNASGDTPAGSAFKIALYTSSATLGTTTTAYSATNEVANSGQYLAGGGLLVNLGTSLTAGVARVDFSDRSFTGVTLTARGALIYNTSSATTNAAVCVLDFGSDKTATSGTFTVQFPAQTSTAAILRISG